LLWSICSYFNYYIKASHKKDLVHKKNSVLLKKAISKSNQKKKSNAKVDVFFDGREMQDSIINAINSIKKKGAIDIAAFRFTSHKITNALIQAITKKGVMLRMVVDKEGISPCVLNLYNKKAEIFSYFKTNDNGKAHGPMMHNKFILLQPNEVFTGSVNYTENGFNSNKENMIRINCSNIYSKYSKNFSNLIMASTRFGF
jgi:phosphatidylserine/phosphatidylglycerophosphate/cardiolipin synthase-like enzyme